MRWMWLALAGALLSAEQVAAADVKGLASLTAPPPASTAPFPAGSKTQPIRLARIVAQLPPETWAAMPDDGRFITWEDGQLRFDTPAVARIFGDEMTKAGITVEGVTGSLFEQDAKATLVVGARIISMSGRFCQECLKGFFYSEGHWGGAVVMTIRWEIYSTLERKVVASVETTGGFSHFDKGLSGEPELLVFEALRDGVRRLTASEDFRRTVIADPELAPKESALQGLITFSPAKPGKRPIGSTTSGVVAIFSGAGHGTGFLISQEGHLLTNHHVVGGAKYVKVRWSDGSETLGEIIRSDRRRDIAIIKVEVSQRQPLPLRPTAAAVGDTVFAVGTPLDPKFQGSVTRGVLSATRTLEGLPYIQSDVVINGGNSGGPLLDEAGAVIGICVSGMEINGAPVGINLFIPIDEALKALALTPAA